MHKIFYIFKQTVLHEQGNLTHPAKEQEVN